MREVKTCKHCGGVYVIGRKGYCEACGNFYRKNNRLPERSEMRRNRRGKCELCENCKRDYATNGKLCRACYRWERKHFTKRPLYLTEKFCTHCKEAKVYCKGLCKACYYYKQDHGKQRPRYLFATECKNCGSVHVKALGLCVTCYNYQYRYGRSRPAYLFGKHVKCDCGKPAVQEVTVKVNQSTTKYHLCADCLKEEQRSIY